MATGRLTYALVPARGGSRSVPRKNVLAIAGRPLLHWVLDAATACSGIDDVWVATEDQEIATVAEAHESGRIRIFWRSPETATDIASTESVMLEFAAKMEFDSLLLLQATSPLQTRDDLERGLALYRLPETDSVVALVRQKRFIWKLDEEGYASPQNYDPLNRPRRQEVDGYLVENGAYTIMSREGLLTSRCRLHGRIRGCELSEETYLEVDDPSDWYAIEGLLRARLESGGN